MRIFEIVAGVFSKRRRARFADETPLLPETDLVQPPPTTPLEALERIHEIQSIHNLISLAVNRLSWTVLSKSSSELRTENPVLTARLEHNAGLLAADYLMLAECYVTDDLQRIHPRLGMLGQGRRIARFDDQQSFFYASHSPLAGASWLIRKLWELHRAETQLLASMGAGAFVVPSDGAMPLTQEELTTLRTLLKDKVRRGGVGGLEPLSAAVDIKPVPVDVAKYQLVQLRTQLVRELCNLFAIDSSLMNDPDNKTYSNKDLALRALYTNVIIPLSYELKYKLELAFPEITIDIDHSNIEILHADKEAQAKYIIMLLQAGIIDIEKAQEMLEL